MLEHKQRFILIAILVPTVVLAIVLLALFGDGNATAERVLGWLEGAGMVLGPALVDAWADHRKQQQHSDDAARD